MTPAQQWRDLLDGERARRDDFKKKATFQRKEWLKARKEKRWLDALRHKDREMEYRNSASNCQSFIDNNKGRAE